MTASQHRVASAMLAVSLVGASVAWAWHSIAARKVHTVEPAPAPVQPMQMMPDFALTERSGRRVTRADLRGKPWVADFIFTSCAGPCPLMSTHMAALQTEFADRDVRFVSFTLDPERDTPEVLTRYAKRYGADPQRWLFLTGEESALQALAMGGLHLVARRSTDAERTQGADRIIHSTRFVLIDGEGRVRGWFVGTDDDDLARLRDALEALCRRTGN